MPIFNFMNELALDKSHDIYLVNGSIARILKKRESVSQAVECMLKTEEGEVFSNSEHGVPWLESICNLPVSFLDVAQKIIKEKIESVTGVDSVDVLEISSDGRNMSGKFAVSCENESATGEF